MSEFEKKLSNIFEEEKKNINNNYYQMINKTLEKLPNKRRMKKEIHNFKICFVSFCGTITLITGVAFAKDIENFIKDKFFLGKGFESAIENDYIENPQMNMIESQGTIKNSENVIAGKEVKTDVKINEFVMDDYNLSLEFNFKFDKNLEKYVNLEENYDIELTDLFVVDENDKILFTAPYISKDKFDEICSKLNLPYKYQEYNENYINSGINSFCNIDLNETNLIYNIYTNENYPKSKKLNLKFTEISFISKEKNEKTVLTGDWNIELDIPEKFYNRESIVYKEKSCSNEKYKVVKAVVYNTCTEIYIEGENERIPDGNLSEKIYQEYKENKISENELNKKLQEWNQSEEGKKWQKEYDLFPVDFENWPYIENENGEKFEESLSVSSKKLCERTDDGKVYYINTFSLTKNDATNNLKVVLHHKDGDITIELER